MTAQRMVYLFFAGMIALGIGLTGIDKAHWVLYIPVFFLSIAGLTGFCPGLIIWKKVGFR